MSEKVVKQESSINTRRDWRRWKKCEVWNGNVFPGTYVVYGSTPVGVTPPFACDVLVDSLEESDVAELRGYREQRRRAGKKVRSLRRDTLRDELLVILAPGLSPKDVIESLQAVIDNIKSDGLLTGRTEANGDFLIEKLDGTITQG
jgi:hypothetical protein